MKKSTKEKLKKWIRHVIPVRGDRVLWGQQLTGDRRRQRNREDRGHQDQGGGGAGQPDSQAQEEPTARERTEVRSQEQDTEPESGGLPGLDMTSQNKTSDTQLTGNKILEEKGVITKTRYQKRQTERDSMPGCLPCSRTAVVKTSPQESRKTRSRWLRCSGEGRKYESCAAAVLPQDRLLQVAARGTSRQKQRSFSGNWTLLWTRGSLGWRKGVG